jgi:hypothetical protein
MKKRELLKQLHDLRRTIKPDLKWQEANREILLSQIKAQTKLNFVLSHKLLVKNFLVAVYKPVGAMILVASILFGTWIATVGAAKNSLPGDFLYGLKLTTERMQVNLTMNDEKRTNLEFAFAERRLDEIKKTAAKDESSKNKKNIEATLKKFQESINNVKSNLAKLEITDKQAALKVADLIDQKAKEYIDIIKDQQATSPQLADNKETEQAISISKATADKALSLIVKEFESGESELILDQVKDKINARILDLEKNLISVQSEIDLIIVNKKLAEEKAKAEAEKQAAEEKVRLEAEKAAAIAETTNTAENTPSTETKPEGNPNTVNDSNTNTNSNVAQPDPAPNTNSNEVNVENVEEAPLEEVLPTIEEIKDKPKEIEMLIAKAKGYLQSNSVSQAFDFVRQAEDVMTLVDKVIEANKQYLDTQINNDTTSSVDNVIGKEEEVKG